MMSILEFTGNFLLFALVFGMSATVDVGQMKEQVKNRKAILLGIFCQFILLPFFGFVIVKIMKLDVSIGLTLLVGEGLIKCIFVMTLPTMHSLHLMKYDLQYYLHRNTCFVRVFSCCSFCFSLLLIFSQ